MLLETDAYFMYIGCNCTFTELLTFSLVSGDFYIFVHSILYICIQLAVEDQDFIVRVGDEGVNKGVRVE